MSQAVQQLVNALSLGGTYALLALGLAVVFNIMGFINFAHGELITVTGFSIYLLEQSDFPWGAAAPLGIAFAVLAAVMMERVAFRPVRGASGNTLLITSFAVSMIIQTLLLAFVSARPQAVESPSLLSKTARIGSISIGVLDITTIAMTGAVLVGLVYFFNKTSLGVSIRAAAEDFEMSRWVGIKANNVIVAAFALSGLLAGFAGIVWIAKIGTVEPGMGLNPILKAFISGVLGGLGSLSGAAAGGFLLGGIEVFMQATLPTQLLPYGDALAIALVVVVLSVRPRGLFARGLSKAA